MRTLYYFLIGIVLFYIDTVIALLIPMNIGNKSVIFVPHLTLMYLVLLCVRRRFTVALIMSIVLGLMTDVYFGTIYGLYTFGYILMIVIFDQFFKVFYRDKSMLFILTLFSTLGIELFVALIYGILHLIDFYFFDFIVLRLIPTLSLNFILLLILYPILDKFFDKIQQKIDTTYR